MAAPIIEGFAPDVAHLHHLTCLSTKIVRDLAAIGVPVFFTLHDYWLICHRGQLLDRQLHVCDGPEPSGCGACLGSAGGVGAGVYAARSVLTKLERALPAAVARPLRAAGARSWPGPRRRAPSASEPRAHGPHARGGRSHHALLCAIRFMRDRFVAFGVDPSRITCVRVRLTRGFADRSPAESRRLPPLRLGFLGSLMVSKAPHLLLEAAAGLPPGSVSVELFGEHVDYHGDASYRARLAPLLVAPARARARQDRS